MSMTANVYLISQAAYNSATEGNLENFQLQSDAESVNLDKAWHAIHYLITGDPSLNFLLTGSQVKGIDELFEVHSPDDISDLKRKLSEKFVSKLISSYQPKEFNALNIYGGPGWDGSSVKYIEQYLTVFLDILKEATKRGDGIAVSIS